MNRAFAISVLAAAAALLLTRTAYAAPGYTYREIWEGSGNQYQGPEERYCPGVAINNRGDVVFRTGQFIPGIYPPAETIRVYVAHGDQAPQVVYQTATNNVSPAPSGLQCNEFALLGINDNGVAAVPLKWPVTDESGNIVNWEYGYGLVSPGLGVIREIRGLINSSGRLNNALQMAGVDYQYGSQLVVTDGVSSHRSTPLGYGQMQGYASVNASGMAATGGVLLTSPYQTAVMRGTSPDLQLSVTPIGEIYSSNSTGNTNFFSSGINDRGWLSFSTNISGNADNPDPRILLVDPTGTVFPVADALSSPFANFLQTRGQSSQGTSLNNFNRVSFVGELDADGPFGSNSSIYVGDASDDAPHAAIDNEVSFGDGRTFDGFGSFANDVADHGVNSMNDRGEIAAANLVQVYDAANSYSGQKQILIVARPVPGMEPGSPIIPAAADALPGGGWRFTGCRRSTGTQVPAGNRCWVDPAIATAYDFAMDAGSPGGFESVLIPVPLPAGDQDFTVEFNSLSVPMTAGHVFRFADYSPDPVRNFRISGIDATEGLDPSNAAAFVTGVIFTDNDATDLSFTMVPNVQGGGGDYTAPVVNPAVTGTQGSNDWYTGDVSLSWSVTDPESPIDSSNGCDATSVTADTIGDTFSCTATSAGGTGSKSITIKRDTVAPTATETPAPLPNADGWNKTDVTVTFTGTDPSPGSGIANCTAAAQLTIEGLHSGVQGFCTDNAGHDSNNAVAPNIRIDKTPPTVTASRSPAPNAAGWNRSTVTVTYTATDSLSGVPVGGCDAPTYLSSDGAGQSATGHCHDLAGNDGSATASGINIDTTPPVATADASPAPNANGWNNSNVTVTFSATDSLSGSGVASCSLPVTVTFEGGSSGVQGYCTDVAGNDSNTAAAPYISIDKTAPSVFITTPAASGSYYQGSSSAANYSCSDSLSGVASCAGPVVNGAAIDTSTTGTKSFTVNASDRAGNTSSATRSYTVVTPPPSVQPVLSGTLGDNGWYRSNVSLSWQVTSPYSAITSTSGCKSVSVTKDTAGTTYTCSAANAGGTTAQSITIKRDTTTPGVTITTPKNKGTYSRGSTVLANYQCTDKTSGLTTTNGCVGPVPSGSAIDTSTTGTKTFTVSARDQAGNGLSATATYTVK